MYIQGGGGLIISFFGENGGQNIGINLFSLQGVLFGLQQHQQKTGKG